VLEVLRSMPAYPALNGVFTADYRGGVRSLGGLRLWQVDEQPNAISLVE
jgi:hypothetical protein